MKKITGYLLDRSTGLGIPGKVVSFQKLDGTSIASADTYYLDKSSVTDPNGRFYAHMELSPGPVNVVVTVSGSEVKARKHDEMAKVGGMFTSDLRLLAEAEYGVIDNFLDEMLLSTPSGHTIRIARGAAIFNANIFSIEQASYDIVGTANGNASLNPRLDLVTLRQYNESAAGQLAGKQEVIVTLGVASNVVPTVPTGADFEDFPIGVVSTAYNAASKTVYRDDRIFNTKVTPHGHPLTRTVISGGVVLPSLTAGSVTVTCPAGYIATGGGHWTTSVDGGTYISFPVGTTQWQCGFKEVFGGYQGFCYVVCLLSPIANNS